MKKILSLLLALALLSLPILSGCRNALPAETAPVGQQGQPTGTGAETKPT